MIDLQSFEPIRNDGTYVETLDASDRLGGRTPVLRGLSKLL